MTTIHSDSEITVPTIPLPQAHDSLGQWLIRARLLRGFEPRDVAQRLRINVAIIEALEADDPSRYPEAPVFMRGHVRRLARLLHLPEQDVLDRYKQLTTVEPPPLKITASIKPQVRFSDTGVRWFSYVLVFALASWLGWLGIEQVTTHLQAADTLPLVGIPSASQAPIPLPQPLIPAPSRSLRTEHLPPIPTPRVSPPNTKAASASTTVSAPAPATTPPIPPGHAEIVLTFKEDCWVDIQDADDQQVVRGVLKAQRTHTFTGRAPFAIRLGKPMAINQFLLNGEPVEPAVYQPKRGSSSRFTLHNRQTTATAPRAAP